MSACCMEEDSYCRFPPEVPQIPHSTPVICLMDRRTIICEGIVKIADADRRSHLCQVSIIRRPSPSFTICLLLCKMKLKNSVLNIKARDNFGKVCATAKCQKLYLHSRIYYPHQHHHHKTIFLAYLNALVSQVLITWQGKSHKSPRIPDVFQCHC